MVLWPLEHKKKEGINMKSSDLKRILTGLSITTLLAGAGTIGIGQVHAQGG